MLSWMNLWLGENQPQELKESFDELVSFAKNKIGNVGGRALEYYD